eukprot:TRINITY_DN13092_c0_g2_i1.p1 TRINITY_DN13092_c0_g2~~TRINITY_DN13092_c0_g2_i1.p1  ORF type:complete len:846 (+),score=123.00 TRINITY_DN13092_c0_g2_i1:50-2587(+)
MGCAPSNTMSGSPAARSEVVAASTLGGDVDVDDTNSSQNNDSNTTLLEDLKDVMTTLDVVAARKCATSLLLLPIEQCRGEIREIVHQIHAKDPKAGLLLLPPVMRHGVHTYSELKELLQNGFVPPLIKLITNIDSDTNPKLATDILRSLYLQAPPSRSHVRTALLEGLKVASNTDPVNFSAIVTILAFLLPIFEGFNSPLKEAHESILDSLSSLYCLNYISSATTSSTSIFGHVHEVLSNCIRVLLRKLSAESHAKVTARVFSTLLGEWDPTESDKCAHLLGSFHDIIEEMDLEAFTEVHKQLFSHLASCLSSQNSIIAIKGFSVLNSKTMVGFMHTCDEVAVHHLLPPILRGGLHWCPEVNMEKLRSFNMLKNLSNAETVDKVGVRCFQVHSKPKEEAQRDFTELISKLEQVHSSQIETEAGLEVLQAERNNPVNARKPFPTEVDNHLHFAFGRPIGKGSYSVVKYARRIEVTVPQSLWKPYAVKVIAKVDIEENYTEQITQEIELLKKFDCPYITPLFASFSDRKNIYVVMEYCERGDLFKAVFEEGHGSVSSQWLAFGTSQLLTALEYIHQHGYYYGDFKTENILVSSNGFLRLCDFGSCKSAQQLQVINAKPKSARDFNIDLSGTLDFLSPEIVSNEHINCSSDWWAFGVVMAQLSCGVLPFSATNESELVKQILYSEPFLDPCLPDNLRALIRGFLAKDPTVRFSASDCRKSDVFGGIPWDDLDKMNPPPVGFGYKPKMNMADSSFMERKYSIRQSGVSSAKVISLPPIPEEAPSQCSWDSEQPVQERLWRAQEKSLSVPPLKKTLSPKVVATSVATPSNDLSEFCTTRPQPVQRKMRHR